MGEELLGAFEVASCQFNARVGFHYRCLAGFGDCLERARVDLEEDVALLDVVAVSEHNFFEVSRDARADLHGFDAFDSCRI